MTTEELKKVFNAKKWKIDKDGKECAGFKDTKVDAFIEWFNIDEFDKGCHYCGLTNNQSLELYNLRPYATRGGKRGKRLELDRKNPVSPYDDLDNIVWCCYWCNNAKTNFFSNEEFKEIGLKIGEVLREVLLKDTTLKEIDNINV